MSLQDQIERVREGTTRMRQAALGRPAEYRGPGEAAPIEIPSVVMTTAVEGARAREDRGGLVMGAEESLTARWSKAHGISPRLHGTLVRDGQGYRITGIDRDATAPEWRVSVESI